MSKTTEILNLSYLLDQEKEAIMAVLQRDEHLKKIEDKRVRKLKNELLEIRRKGGRHRIRPQNNQKICIRCQKNLGLIFDRGQVCPNCQLRVCNACRVVVKDGAWKCTICAKITQLKIVTGEWFFEEKAKRFKNSNVLGSDVVKKSIMRKSVAPKRVEEEAEKSAKTDTKDSTTMNDSSGNPQNDTRTLDKKKTPGKADDTRSIRSIIDTQSLRSTRSELQSDGVLDKKSGKQIRNGDDGSIHSQQETRSMRSTRSVAQSERGSVQSLNNSGPQSKSSGSTNSTQGTLPRKTSKTSGTISAPQSSPTPSKRSMLSNFSHTSGLENGMRTSKSIPDNLSVGHKRQSSLTPSVAVSRVSVASERSISEVDLSGGAAGGKEDTASIRSRSVPGGLNNELYLDEAEEDIDELINSHNSGNSGNMRNAFSTNVEAVADRKWSHLNVPDADADTTSLNSMTSVYSEMGDYGNVKVTGEILLNINYSYKTGALNILVKNCRNLAVADEKKNRTDPYVKAYLLPDKSRQSKRKTKIKTNTTNPDFNETLKYVISHTQLQTRTLQLSVWHNDRFGRNSFLGEVTIPLDTRNFENQEDECLLLQPKVDLASESTLQYKGEITIGLRYTPPEKNLTLPLEPVIGKKSFRRSKKGSIQMPKGGILDVIIKEAKNLTAVKSGGTSDTFVKGYLLPDNSKSSKHKTPIIKKNVNPQWNHTFSFTNLQPADLQTICLELTVWDKESLSSNVFLGGVCLGCGSGLNSGNEVDWVDVQGEEHFLWQRMIDNPGTSVEGTLMLRSTLAKQKSPALKA
ncbi:synaptotagmin-like protein 5 [Pelobates fuscus]|uniref:synaptotagmin-like protein 5 n=1 Tax=Pelobates fuscus TaxID=191477 RepID=UPI002FE4351E